MSKILCPVDFSATSLNAVEYAANIAAASRTVLKLINVFTEKEFNQVVSEEDINYSFQELMELAQQRLLAMAEETLKDYQEAGLVDCEYAMVTGDLHDVLLKETAEQGYQWVVMGTSGIGSSPWMGSNTSKFISKSPTSVICVPNAAVYSGFQKLVYATNVQEEDKIKIQDIVSFATMFDSRIYVVHLTHKSEKLERSESQVFYDELRSFIQYNKISFESRIYSGKVREDLLAFSEEKGAGLLVVYSRNRNYFENLIHKSVARDLATNSNKPLMVLK